MRSYSAKISSTFSLSSRVSCSRTSTSGLISLIESRALSALDRPMSDTPWMIWRCRLDSSTVSNSTMPRVPTPAAARYMSTGEPRGAGGPPRGGGEEKDPGEPGPPRPDGEHLGVLQPLLPVHPDVGDDQVAAVAADLVDGQVGGGLHQGWQGHVLLLCVAGSRLRKPARSCGQQPGTRSSSRFREVRHAGRVGRTPRPRRT